MRDYLFHDVNIRQRYKYSTSIFKIYRMIQNRIEHQSGRDEHWRLLVKKCSDLQGLISVNPIKGNSTIWYILHGHKILNY